MKINGLIDHPRWYDIKCKCDHSSVETEFPIKDCLHCKFQKQEDSMPREDFTVKENDIDDNGEPLESTHDKTVTEIIIDRGDKYQDIRGWKF
jgi:hypothetical protein|tara:strand:+ start:2806 stop:3081 length:276 start_codon:yes stop_codon:yes gene_type:complete